MLSIVETLNEFRTMLLGYCIKIYTDHENLTRLTTVSKSPRIQRWRWTIEEFGPTIEYIKGPRNVVADALSRLDTEVSSTTTS
jgi:putative transposase